MMDLLRCDFLLHCAAACSTAWESTMGGVMLEMLVLGGEAVPPLLGRTQVESCRLVLEAAVVELDGVEDTGGRQGGHREQD